MSIVLFDDRPQDFYPLTLTRPVGDLRMGIFTFAERWKNLLQLPVYFKTQDYLQIKYPNSNEELNYFINPRFFPDDELISAIQSLKQGEAIIDNGVYVAFYGKSRDFDSRNFARTYELKFNVIKLLKSWDLFTFNHLALEFDFTFITNQRKGCEIPVTAKVIGDKNRIFIEDGAKVSFCFLNVEKGPIYVGKNAEIMEGVMVRGGLALCEGATLNMGAKIYGATTIGPYSKVGGEVNNSILWGYSNKAHDGFLGNSVIGQWCNLGADTNNSNLKNNYSPVKMWDYESESFVNTGLTFCGLVMGDHSKSAINTQFNTGTTCGVFSILFESGFLPKYIPSFSWGGKKGSPKLEFDKAVEIAKIVMNRRSIEINEIEIGILEKIYNSLK